MLCSDAMTFSAIQSAFISGNVGVHLPGRFGVRRVLEDHLDAIHLEFLDVLFDVPVRRDQPDWRRPTRA